MWKSIRVLRVKDFKKSALEFSEKKTSWKENPETLQWLKNVYLFLFDLKQYFAPLMATKKYPLNFYRFEELARDPKFCQRKKNVMWHLVCRRGCVKNWKWLSITCPFFVWTDAAYKIIFVSKYAVLTACC